MTPRKPLPDHARDQVEDTRDLLMEIKAEMQRLLDVAKYAAQSNDESGWKALAHAISCAGTTINLAAGGVRLLETIEGIDQPPDQEVIKLAARRHS